MEVILLEKIHRLGELGDKVSVRAGYGRNYLIPQRKAVPATADNVARFEEQRAELERAQAESKDAATSRAESMAELTLSIPAKAGTEGKLFGSVGTSDIAQAAEALGVEISKSEIRLPNGPLREIGEFEVEVHLHADVEASIAVHVVHEDGTATA